MTRSRGANRNARNSDSLNVGKLGTGLVSKINFVAKSTSHATINNAGSHFAGNESRIHPYYGTYGGVAGSIDSAFMNGSVVNKNISYGLVSNLLVKKAKYTLRFRNLEAFAVRIAILPVASSLIGALGLNSNGRLDEMPGCKYIDLNKAGVTGDMKSITVSFDCAKINGYTEDQYQGINGYYGASNSTGTVYTGYYISMVSDDVSTNFVNGVSMLSVGEFDCTGTQQNVTLDA